MPIMDLGPASNNNKTPPGPPGSQSPSTSPIAHHSRPPFHAKLSNGYGQAPMTSSQPYGSSPVAERRSIDQSPPKYTLSEDAGMIKNSADGVSVANQSSAILLRRLPSTLSNEALVSMLLFAEDFLDVRFTGVEAPEDAGYQTAVAHFRTLEGAYEARKRLHGRLNATNDANMIVDIIQPGISKAPGARRKTSDEQSGRQMSTSASSGGSSSSTGQTVRQPSRYSGTFQSLDKMSPTKVHHIPAGNDARSTDPTSQSHGFFSPQSPINSLAGQERPRISGKSVIKDEIFDDETGELLRDPLAFAKNGHIGSPHRQSSTSQIPVSRLANLHLSTDDHVNKDGMPQNLGFSSNRSLQPLQSPISEFSSNTTGPMSPTSHYHMSPSFQRTHYPPANPADQNPPCNTLYVGNLPVDASEDELKALFSKQRGYKRLCFRTKHNGPMCFVEFEDITFATKALNELYGTMLHNSIKGGIRLSFSKNPLGVRAGQSNGIGPTSPLGSPGTGYGNGLGIPPGFTTANGPPPGLSMPPGLTSPLSPGGMPSNSGSNGSKFFPQVNISHSGASSYYAVRGQVNSNNYGLSSPNGEFPDFMLGR